MASRMEEEDQPELTIDQPIVVGKYKEAAEIANKAIALVVKECTPGKKIIDICLAADKFMNDSVNAIHKNIKEKGIAFPTCISVNNIVGHFSPNSDNTATLAEGDVAKIDLGVQIDGLIAVAAHTTIVAETAANGVAQPTTGRKADVICAAHYATEVVHRLLKPGKKNTDVTAAILKVAEQFKVEPVEGVLSHNMKQWIIDGNNVILGKAASDQKVDEFEFELNTVYAIDIVMSTGTGKTKETEDRPTVFKRNADENYNVKMKAAEYVIKEVNTRFPTVPFAIRYMDEKRAKLGLTECVSHDLVSPLPVLVEEKGEFVAQFKFTVLITPSGPIRLNSHPLPYVSSEHKIVDEELVKLLKAGTGISKKKSNKKAKTDAAPAKTADAMDTSK